MRIILAYPQDGNTYPGVAGAADQVVDVDVALADRIIQDGWARPAAVNQLRGEELDHVAQIEGVDLSGAATVADKKAAIKAARNEES
jgi:hypothetical protein